MIAELFREGTSDWNVYRSVFDSNEYRLCDSFDPNSLIIDVGAHIGCFAYACTQRGAGRVMCFEPDPENYHLLRQHLAAEIATGKVETFPVAVTNSLGFRTFSGVVRKDGETNHGGAYLFGADKDSYGLDEFIVNPPFRVVSIPFDAIEFPDGFSRRLVKLDCENSEHEIALSKELATFPQIVGEFHPYGDNTAERLKERLQAHGFEVGLHPWENSELGLFFCRK